MSDGAYWVRERWEAETLSGMGFDNLAYAECREFDERHGYVSMYARDGAGRECERFFTDDDSSLRGVLDWLNREFAEPVTEPKITDPHVDKIEFEVKKGVKRVRFGRVGDVALSGWWVEVLEISDTPLQEWTSVFSASLLDVEDVRWILGVQIGADYGTLLTDVVN